MVSLLLEQRVRVDDPVDQCRQRGQLGVIVQRNSELVQRLFRREDPPHDRLQGRVLQGELQRIGSIWYVLVAIVSMGVDTCTRPRTKLAEQLGRDPGAAGCGLL